MEPDKLPETDTPMGLPVGDDYNFMKTDTLMETDTPVDRVYNFAVMNHYQLLILIYIR